MKPSIFKIALGITVLGIIWLEIIFGGGDRVSESFSLKSEGSAEIQLNFDGSDIGYYTIYIPEFSGGGVFVQILDDKYNVISDGIVETRMSVGYFDFENGGTYITKVTNLSNNSMFLEVELGDTNGREMIIPGMVTLIGGLLIVITIYIRLRDYRIAQPDENIS